MPAKYFLPSVLAAVLPSAWAALNPSCAPGGNFDMGFWNLQLPTGGSSAATIKSADLQGCSGYTDANFFTHQPTGQLVMLAPGNPDLTGCATTSGSEHCRTELREVVRSSGANAAWDPSGTNTLQVTMTVVTADDGTHGTAVGQVFCTSGGTGKPLAEMYYGQDGKIVVGVKPDPSTDQVITEVGQVALGTEFHYVLSYSAGHLSVSINGDDTELTGFNWASPKCYFKTGNYNQGASAGSSEVHISSVTVSH